MYLFIYFMCMCWPQGDHVVFSYVMVTSTTFPDPALAPDASTRREWALRRECRGLVFAKATGQLISRRLLPSSLAMEWSHPSIHPSIMPYMPLSSHDDDDDDDMIRHRYHKFFNVNEMKESQAANIDFSQPHVILEKLDGSMVGTPTPIPCAPATRHLMDPFYMFSAPYMVEGRLIFATKKGHSPVSDDVQKHVERVKASHDYFGFLHFWIHQGFTP